MQRSKIFQFFWDEHGKWTNLVPISNITLENFAKDIHGSDKDKDGFLHFIWHILRWEPEERPSTKDLIFDPWLIEDFGFSDEQIRYYQEHWLEEEGPEEGSPRAES